MDLIRTYYQTPFILRLGVLLAFLAAVAGIELAVKGKAAGRWREYQVWFVFGLVGGLVGMAVDLVTYNLSPAYFELGKGIVDASLGDALGLGFEAGFLVGMVVGGLFLWAGQPGLGYRRIAVHLVWPVGLGLLAAIVNPLFLRLDLIFAKQGAFAGLTVHQAERFVTVAQVHVGVYAGGLLGTVVGLISIRMARVLD